VVSSITAFAWPTLLTAPGLTRADPCCTQADTTQATQDDAAMSTRRPVNKALDALSTAVSTLSFEEGFEEEEALLGGAAYEPYAAMGMDDRRSAAFEEPDHPPYHASHDRDVPPPPPPDSVNDRYDAHPEPRTNPSVLLESMRPASLKGFPSIQPPHR
jgi:hypothetical protein